MQSDASDGGLAAKSATHEASAYPSTKAGVASAQQLLHAEIEDMTYGTSVATSSASVRAGFLYKVYSILAIQLGITSVLCVAFMYIEPLRVAVLSVGALLSTVAVVAALVTLLGLFGSKDSHPANLYWLGAFTVAEATSIGVICALYQENGMGILVLQALVITLAIFSSITLYCFVTKKDFSFLGGALYAALVGLLIASVCSLLLGLTGHRSPWIALAISWFGAILFTLYIFYDTSVIMNHLGPDDYVIAAVTLYLDIINLFLYVLQILAASQRD